MSDGWGWVGRGRGSTILRSYGKCLAFVIDIFITLTWWLHHQWSETFELCNDRVVRNLAVYQLSTGVTNDKHTWGIVVLRFMMWVDILITHNNLCIGLWSEPNKIDCTQYWHMRRKRCDRIHETNEQQQRMVWVEVYVFDQEWVVEVYDMCDQEWLSEDIIWRVVIGSNRQLGGLGNLCVYYKILKVQCGSPRGYEYWTTYIGYVHHLCKKGY